MYIIYYCINIIIIIIILTILLDNVLKEFPFFFDMDEIFRVKLHNVKLDSTPSSSTIDKISNYNSHLQGNNNTESFDLNTNSTNNLLSSFLDIESIQKLLKKNNDNNRTNDEIVNTSDQENIKGMFKI